MGSNDQPDELEKWARQLLWAAGVLIAFSFFAPYFLTRPFFTAGTDFSKTGSVADTIGGLMTPFIALAGIIVTGLAFFMQYKANLIQRQQLNNQDAQHKVQQFESHFFELLRLHKENVSELEVYAGRNVQYKGRSVFKLGVEEIHSIIKNLQPVSAGYGREMPADDRTFPSRFHNAYTIFFWEEKSNQVYDIDGVQISFSFRGMLNESSRNWNAVFGHYYRHLFFMVKYVTDSNIIRDHQDKLGYLAILRAQLSNYEQIMLFYNWLSGYGESWETEAKDEQGKILWKNEFFTRYRMIHNVWKREVYPHSYFLNALDALDKKSKAITGKPLLEEDE